jgi:hypothetical protein
MFSDVGFNKPEKILKCGQFKYIDVREERVKIHWLN